MRSTTVTLSVALVLAAVGYAVAQTSAMPGTVHVMNGMLTDAKGMSLYTFDNDKEPNKSACSGNCLNNWPPLKAEAGDKNMGEWTVITRDDGTKQWAYKSKPLYYFAMDKAAGDKNGDGRGMVWHLAKP